MGQVHHGSATTTAAIRRAIQNSQESLRVLSQRYGINPKTVAKWKKRTSVADLPTGPRQPRSSLHRCLQRHGIGRLPDVEGDKPAKKKVKAYPIGYFHIDIAEGRTAEGKLHMFVAIDRTSKFAFVELHEKATTAVSREFLLRLIEAVPYKSIPCSPTMASSSQRLAPVDRPCR